MEPNCREGLAMLHMKIAIRANGLVSAARCASIYDVRSPNSILSIVRSS